MANELFMILISVPWLPVGLRLNKELRFPKPVQLVSIKRTNRAESQTFPDPHLIHEMLKIVKTFFVDENMLKYKGKHPIAIIIVLLFFCGAWFLFFFFSFF